MVMDGGVTVLLVQSPVFLMCLVFKVFHYTCVHSKMSLSSAELNQYLPRSTEATFSVHRVISCFSASEFHPSPSWVSWPPMIAKHKAASLRVAKGTCPGNTKMHVEHGLQNLRRRLGEDEKFRVAVLRAFHEAKCQRRRRRLKRHIHLG